MSELKTLHRGISQVRRFRQGVARGSGLSMFVTVILVALTLALLLDVFTVMSKLERAITWGVLLWILVWAFRRYMIPALAFRESKVEAAMLVERQRLELVALERGIAGPVAP